MSLRPSDLHVVFGISNPMGYRRRAELCKRSMSEFQAAGVTVWLVEATFGGREPEVARAGNPHHLVVRCDSPIWLKENLWNLAERHLLPDDAEYIMGSDTDFQFLRDDWPMATLDALRHWRVVQPFSHVVDLGPETETISVTSGFAYDYNRGNDLGDGSVFPGRHPGYAWAWRRKCWREMGGMLERCVTGAADHHQALALVQKVWLSIPEHAPAYYKDYVSGWEHRANHVIQQDVGHVAGTIAHRFHGFKAKRGYLSRWQIIYDTGFEPFRDLVADDMGLLRLAPNTSKLRDMMRAYFRGRNEDQGSISWPTLSGGEW